MVCLNILSYESFMNMRKQVNGNAQWVDDCLSGIYQCAFMTESSPSGSGTFGGAYLLRVQRRRKLAEDALPSSNVGGRRIHVSSSGPLESKRIE